VNRTFSHACRLLLLLALALSLCACKSAGIKKAYMARDSEGRNKTSVFAKDNTEIHLIVEMASGRDDVVLKALLSTTSTGTLASQEEFTPGKGDTRLDIYLYRKTSTGEEDKDGPWVEGAYTFDLQLDGDHEESVSFSVQ
jgi:hypothetical protein